jgi:hypothetical protein
MLILILDDGYRENGGRYAFSASTTRSGVAK